MYQHVASFFHDWGAAVETIFLPIKPIYANRIIAGIKHYEYRRSIPSKEVSYIIIYASSPQQKIVGIGIVDKVLSAPTDTIWEQTGKHSGISEADYYAYFEGRDTAYAFQFSEIRKLTERVSPLEFWKEFKIPQSFRYLDQDSSSAIFSLQYERVLI